MSSSELTHEEQERVISNQDALLDEIELEINSFYEGNISATDVVYSIKHL